jgi:hypothetical protein
MAICAVIFKVLSMAAGLFAAYLWFKSAYGGFLLLLGQPWEGHRPTIPSMSLFATPPC